MDKLRKEYVKRRKSNKIPQKGFSGISATSISKFELGGDIYLSNFVRILNQMDYELVIIDKR